MPVYGNLYNDEIYYLDDIVYRLWDIIATSRDRDETIFIITSDHGEHLGEKGFYGHLLSLHNELVWVPLIIIFPKALNKKGREDRLVSLNDLYSTILDVVQSPRPRPETSFSLLDGHEREVILSQHIYPEFFRSILGTKTELSQLKGVDFSPSVLAIITAAGIKIMESRDGSLQVYNLQNDPDEHHDLAPTMSLDALNQLRLMMELFKEDTSYREALEEVSRLKPMFAEENLL